FVFFRAEDGIRDFHVTGVQTCALPIFAQQYLRAARERVDDVVVRAVGKRLALADELVRPLGVEHMHAPILDGRSPDARVRLLRADRKASCRERVDSTDAMVTSRTER